MMKSTDLQTKPQRHLEGRQIGGDETDELFINNPDHPLKATERGNQTREVEYVENQDRKPKRNPDENIFDDKVSTGEQ